MRRISWRCTVLAFDGTSWSPVGSAGFSGQAANYQSIAFKPDTKAPYVAYQDGGSGPITVQAYDGSNWNYIGSSQFRAEPKSALTSTAATLTTAPLTPPVTTATQPPTSEPPTP